MRNQATRWIAEYMEQNQISVEDTAKILQISTGKLSVDTEMALDADELLRVCAYLQVRPEDIPIDKEGEEK